MLETINQVAQVVLAVCAVVATAVAAVGGTRWGKSKAAQTTRDLLAILQAVAETAVRATEQDFKFAPIGEDAVARQQQKRESALGRFFTLLPPGVEVSLADARALIERAVHDMNAEKASAAFLSLEQASVDPQ